MGYLVLLTELSRQVSALPDSRQYHRGCRISNFDECTEECLHDKRRRRRNVSSQRAYTTSPWRKYRLQQVSWPFKVKGDNAFRANPLEARHAYTTRAVGFEVWTSRRGPKTSRDLPGRAAAAFAGPRASALGLGPGLWSPGPMGRTPRGGSLRERWS
jgi:hypothetical protein